MDNLFTRGTLNTPRYKNSHCYDKLEKQNVYHAKFYLSENCKKGKSIGNPS